MAFKDILLTLASYPEPTPVSVVEDAISVAAALGAHLTPAGAPIDKGAGIRLFKKIGDQVEQGEPLYRVYAFDSAELDLAAATAKANSGYMIDGADVRSAR